MRTYPDLLKSSFGFAKTHIFMSYNGHHYHHNIDLSTSGWVVVRNLLAMAFPLENKRDKSSRPQTHTCDTESL